MNDGSRMPSGRRANAASTKHPHPPSDFIIRHAFVLVSFVITSFTSPLPPHPRPSEGHVFVVEISFHKLLVDGVFIRRGLAGQDLVIGRFGVQEVFDFTLLVALPLAPLKRNSTSTSSPTCS